jgi:hypothetical protein
MDGGAIVEQTAWQNMANILVQCEFNAQYPPHSGLPPVSGAMGIFLANGVERIRIIFSPSNLSQPGAPAYDQIDLNFLKFEGKLAGGDNVGFTNNLEAKPTFDEWEGWKFEFSEAISRFSDAPHKFDEHMTAERIVANCICTESFEVSTGRRAPGLTLERLLGGKHRIPVGTEILFPVILRDTEGLRQSISDIAGEAYVNRLLRMHGYEIDRGRET